MLSKELLERFKRGELVFHTPTQEIFDKVVEAVRSVGCQWSRNNGDFRDYEELTGIDNEGSDGITYCDLEYYRSNYPELEIITLSLSDFDSESKEVPQDTQAKLMDITRAIAYCRKLEETYDTDLELDGLYEAREEILRELEDSLAIHL